MTTVFGAQRRASPLLPRCFPAIEPPVRKKLEEKAAAPGPASIDLIVPETSAARRSMMISLPSEAISLTGSIDDCARAEAAAARTTDCMLGIGMSMVLKR